MKEEIIMFNKYDVESLEKSIKRLEQENKELKEKELYRGIDRQFIEDANDRLYFKAEKYRKALEEIRELLNKDCDYLGRVVEASEFINEVLK